MSTVSGPELDHVLIAVSDLDEAARELETRHGLVAVEGGRHEGWGTQNRIVPLGGTYLEVISILDEETAAESPFGRWVADNRVPGGRPLGWCVRTDALDDVAGRLGLEPIAGSRVGRDGSHVHWRVAGLERAIAEPFLPFFIEWEAGTAFPGRMPVEHPVGLPAIERIELEGDPDRLASWLGPHELPIDVTPGIGRVSRIHLTRGIALDF